MLKKITEYLIVAIITTICLMGFNLYQLNNTKLTVSEDNVKIPETIGIGGIIYKIELKNNYSECWNVDKLDNQIININSKLLYDDQKKMLMHEIMHIATYEYAINTDDFGKDLYYDKQTSIILRLIKDNPKLIEWLGSDNKILNMEDR